MSFLFKNLVIIQVKKSKKRSKEFEKAKIMAILIIKLIF